MAGSRPNVAERVLMDLLMARYDRLMQSRVFRRFYGESGFFNLGYWAADTGNPREACARLVDLVLDGVGPAPTRVLDVGCGMGGTTRMIAERFPEARIAGVNLSHVQLEYCRMNAARGRFAQMDAARLGFADGSFDAIVSVEAMPHFNPREAFLAGAFRALVPGGALAVSDVLFGPPSARHTPRRGWLADYSALYKDAGFGEVRVTDVTAATWEPFRRYVVRWAREQRRARAIGWLDCVRVLAGPLAAVLTLQKYLLVSARRPARAEPTRREIASRDSAE
jgi:SAM-dependent methyltransferase